MMKKMDRNLLGLIKGLKKGDGTEKRKGDKAETKAREGQGKESDVGNWGDQSGRKGGDRKTRKL